ncbi:DUF3881 family protein [Muricomes sp. OA1]|jgi:hypothetical protein|uniref:DUF3881 family protein n=1 Tax=Hungatella hathewayi TaxID=154046 RepID=A0A3E2X1T4_9FIRM|nr:MULTISPECIES: DUF3881 family protein [Clostridia]MEE0202421.1 DUF3881 family protein [Muricomes sp.]MCH1971779.1 DUF3881 family protein [Muricomes sp. OA1]MRM87678.1 DUF3881 family protein [Faecalicatena contorta]RGC35447.1 DUF3881 family protein [Hungatella hathewayi]GKH35053.1 hypothetical protein CE91St64_44600 [Faecalicatena contorta]
MHQYLKAIGFNNLKTKKDIKELLNQVETTFTHQTIVSYQNWADYCEFQKEYGQNVGITLCGELDEFENFDADYYFPYFEGSGVTTYADVIVEKRIEKEEYVGICEDPKVGISLIFHLQNGIEYMRERQLGFATELAVSVTFSGLALSGKILFPVKKSEDQVKNEKEASDNRKVLLNAARSGDQTAIETLTLDDIDTYSKVSRRLIHEDIFTIVDTYFMPYGVECDLYSIMGEILAVRKRENTLTKEPLYQMKLDVNELQFDVCVPAKEVMGEPEIGRRFKGTIWLQGYINF